VAGPDRSPVADLTGPGADCDTHALYPAEPLLEALAATRADGAERHLILSEADRDFDALVCLDADKRLVLGLADRTPAAGQPPLRPLARQMAGETDTGALLDILCNEASSQCAAAGAAVLKAVGHEGEIVAAMGILGVARAKRFPLARSLARDVIRTRDVVSVADFGASRPLIKAVPELRVGPVMLAPLIAHEVMLGVLGVTRPVGGHPFTKREANRLRSIADYAAFALWKAELLEKAQAADRAKSRFLATVSHELRTPLTALAGYEELLADQVIGPMSDAQLDVLERMRSVTHHLASMIEEVLAFSSLDEGREVVRPTDFLAADLARATAAVIEPLARQKRLLFGMSVPEAPIRMTSDVDKVRQILVNLAGNAVKFTDVGEVRLELEREGPEVRYSIRDTGIGIARDDLDRLFKPFAQLDAGLTRRYGGTGLGLYISRSLAQLLGGRIEVESEPKKGSTFTLVLPADAA
jgi:signal transduction histidine kinase